MLVVLTEEVKTALVERGEPLSTFFFFTPVAPQLPGGASVLPLPVSRESLSLLVCVTRSCLSAVRWCVRAHVGGGGAPVADARFFPMPASEFVRARVTSAPRQLLNVRRDTRRPALSHASAARLAAGFVVGRARSRDTFPATLTRSAVKAVKRDESRVFSFGQVVGHLCLSLRFQTLNLENDPKNCH